MIEMLFGTGIPFGGRDTLPATLRDLTKLMPRCAGVRRMGSAALDLAYVAAGRLDGFWERQLNAWDIAAGVLLVRESGGLVGALHEGQDLMTDGDIVAANGEVFDAFTKLLRED
jgi:myo-inositol-1(or 4)-monophosphatase